MNSEANMKFKEIRENQIDAVCESCDEELYGNLELTEAE